MTCSACAGADGCAVCTWGDGRRACTFWRQYTVCTDGDGYDGYDGVLWVMLWVMPSFLNMRTLPPMRVLRYLMVVIGV